MMVEAYTTGKETRDSFKSDLSIRVYRVLKSVNDLLVTPEGHTELTVRRKWKPSDCTGKESPSYTVAHTSPTRYYASCLDGKPFRKWIEGSLRHGWRYN